jgi:hypothetical protein
MNIADLILAGLHLIFFMSSPQQTKVPPPTLVTVASFPQTTKAGWVRRGSSPHYRQYQDGDKMDVTELLRPFPLISREMATLTDDPNHKHKGSGQSKGGDQR